MSASAATVFIVDDDPSVRRALARLVKAEGYVVEAFASPREFLDRSPHECPGCVVLDLRMPGMSGLEVQATLASTSRELPVVFISGRADIAASVKAMKGGAVDFLPKPFQDEQLLAAIRSGIARSIALHSDRAELDDLNARMASLTPREREVFPMVASGLPNKQIAGRLGTAEKTIKVHRARVMEKMKASSLADLVRMAERAGVA